MEALSVLASTSFVCKEREALLELARRETDFVKGLLDETKDRMDRNYPDDKEAEDEEDRTKSADEKFSISLCTSVKRMLKRAEAELDAIDASVGDKMKVWGEKQQQEDEKRGIYFILCTYLHVYFGK